MTASKKPAITIFYDRQCTMCSSLIDTITASKNKEQFVAKDMHTSVLPKDVTLEDVDKEIYVIDTHGTTHKNADAILKIAEEYFGIRYLTVVGKLPVLKQILTFCYNVVAANRHLVSGNINKIFLVKITVVLSFLISLIISSKLWITERMYPLTPVIEKLPSLATPFDYGIFIFLLGLLISLFIIPKPQKIIWACVGVFSVLCIFDQSRLQPWAVQYIFILGVLGLFSWKKNDTSGQNMTLNLLRIIVASTYFYSGLQKINFDFINNVMPWLLQPITSIIPQTISMVPLFGLLAPYIQIFFAIGLLTQRYRRISLILAVLMHIFILIMIGPFGHNWNAVVWPWTAAMAILDIILFTTKEPFTLRGMLSQNLSFSKNVIILFFIVLPILSFFNIWDSYLSSALYSGNITTGSMYVSTTTKKQLPHILQQQFSTTTEQDIQRLDISAWSMQELNVPPYPETRIYLRVLETICSMTDNANDVRLQIQEHRLFNATKNKTYYCS